MTSSEELVTQFAASLDYILSGSVDVFRGEPYAPLQKPNMTGMALTEFETYMERIFGPLQFNPHDDDRNEAIRETYDHTSYSQEVGDSAMPPSAAGFDRIFRLLTDRQTRCIFWLGRRGSGKTFSLNYFLSENFRKLNQQHHTTFFRCDVAKLVVLNNALEAGTEPIAIREFSIAHAFYVAMRWGSVDSLLKPFAYENHLEEDTFSLFLLNLDDEATMHAAVKLWGTIKAQFRKARQFERDSVWFAEKTIKYIARIDPQLFEDLYNYFLMHIKETQRNAGTHAGHVIHIIDGADNLLHKYNGRELRLSYLHQLLPYLPGGQLGDAYTKNIIVLRNDSYSELTQLMDAHRIDAPNKQVAFVSMGVSKPSAIFERKRRVAANPTSKLLRTWRTQLISPPDVTQQRRFDDVAEILLRQLEVAHSFAKTFECRADSAAIDYVFNGNLRSFSRNLVRSYSYLDRFRARDSRIDQQLLHIKQTKDPASITSVWRILLEGSVTAGNNFMTSNYSREVRGRWCPNLFEFRRTQGHEQWAGLSLLRFLQLVRARPDCFTEHSAVHAISKLFKYPDQRVLDAIVTAREFGLIEYGGLVGCLDRRSGKEELLPTMHITAKGEYVIALTFSNAPIAYFMALGTPLSSSATRSFLKSELVHEDKPVGARHFPAPAIVTSIILMRHILSAHRAELGRMNSISPGKDGDLKDVLSRRNDVFALPELGEWKQEVLELFRVLAFTQQTSADSILKRLIGTV